MSRQFKAATVPLNLADYDEIIDVRSPSEFAEDHITGALNFPVLFDEQRVEVGIIYNQVSAFDARKLGAVMVSENIFLKCLVSFLCSCSSLVAIFLKLSFLKYL